MGGLRAFLAAVARGLLYRLLNFPKLFPTIYTPHSITGMCNPQYRTAVMVVIVHILYGNSHTSQLGALAMARNIDLSGALARVLGSMRNPTGGAGTAAPIQANAGGFKQSMGVPNNLRAVADRAVSNVTTPPVQVSASASTALSPIDGIGFSQVLGVPGNRGNLQDALSGVLSRNAQRARSAGTGVLRNKKGKLAIGADVGSDSAF